MDIRDLDPGSARIGIVDQLGALWHPRHSEPSRGQAARTIAIIILQNPARSRIDHDGNSERYRYRVDRDVVMGRSDPARRE